MTVSPHQQSAETAIVKSSVDFLG